MAELRGLAWDAPLGYQRVMQWSACWSVLVVLAVCAAPANCLARVPTRLVYARAPSAVECPDEPALTAAVAARLGYDPFSPWGDQTILATVSRAKVGFVAQAQLIDHDGIAQGTREVKAPAADCSELILSLALAISITLDPLHVDSPTAPEPEPEKNPPADTAVASAGDADAIAPVAEPATVLAARFKDAAPARSSREPVDLVWRAQVSGFGALALARDESFGGRLGLETGRGRWSLALEGWAALPATSRVQGVGAIESSLLAAALVPCFNVFRYARLCALGSLGSLSTRSRDVGAPRSERVLHATVGGRASAAWPIGNRLELLAMLDLAAVLNRPQFQIDGEEVWRPSRVMTVLGLGASVRIF